LPAGKCCEGGDEDKKNTVAARGQGYKHAMMKVTKKKKRGGNRDGAVWYTVGSLVLLGVRIPRNPNNGGALLWWGIQRKL